jgi:hypothetical protein
MATRAQILVILSLFSITNSIQIGKIENNIMIGITNNSLTNITLDQCICQMMTMSNALIKSLNYFQINQTCQLFNSNISSITIELNFNSSFIFLNQSEILITIFQINSKI